MEKYLILKKLEEYFTSGQEEFGKLLAALVSRQSYSKETSNINALLDSIELMFTRFDPLRKRIKTPAGDILVLTFFPGHSDFTVLLSHVDTVRVSEEAPCPVFKNDRLYGNGAYDMKNAVVMFFYIISALNDLKIEPEKTIKLMLTPDEESGSKHSRKYLAEYCRNAKAVVIPEPSGPNGEVKIRRKGIAFINVIITGKPAHSGIEPHAGADANRALLDVFQKIEAVAAKYPDIYFNPGVIAGGVKVNVVSPESFLDGEMRSFSSENLEKALDEIKNLEKTGNIEIKIFSEINRPAFEFTDENRNLYKKAKDFADIISYPLGTYETGGSSDGAILSPLGIPVIDGMGLKGGGAHTNEEYVELSDFPKRAAVIAALLADL